MLCVSSNMLISLNWKCVWVTPCLLWETFQFVIRVDNCLWGGVGKWVARQTRNRWIPVSRDFEPNQKLLLFPWARNFTLIAWYWLVRGTDSSVIYISKNCWFHNQTKINKYKLIVSGASKNFNTRSGWVVFPTTDPTCGKFWVQSSCNMFYWLKLKCTCERF